MGGKIGGRGRSCDLDVGDISRWAVTGEMRIGVVDWTLDVGCIEGKDIGV